MGISAILPKGEGTQNAIVSPLFAIRYSNRPRSAYLQSERNEDSGGNSLSQSTVLSRFDGGSFVGAAISPT